MPIKDRRAQFFFWFGVFILPLFWSWFTLAPAFTRRERAIAFLWMGAFVVWLVHERNAVLDHWETVSVIYPAILGWLTIALIVWLLFRTRFFFPTIIEIIVLIDVVAMIEPSTFFADRVGQAFDWHWLVAPLLAALAHLAIEPLQRSWAARHNGNPTLQHP